MDSRPFPNQSDEQAAEAPRYDGDVVAWANEQARLLRAGEFHRLDIEHIADEIEDVGRAEQRELATRMAVLIAHLLKWNYQPGHRSRSWENTILEQRRRCQRRLKRTPSLRPMLTDEDWLAEMWSDGVAIARQETGLEVFPSSAIWMMETEVLRDDWLPG